MSKTGLESPYRGKPRIRFLHLETFDGGASRDRTDDLKLAKLALSQLSYGPLPANVHTRDAEALRNPSKYYFDGTQHGGPSRS